MQKVKNYKSIEGLCNRLKEGVMKTCKSFIWLPLFIIITMTLSCSRQDDYYSSRSQTDPPAEQSVVVDIVQDNQEEEGPYYYSEKCPSGPELSFDLASDQLSVPYPNNLYTKYDPESPTGRRVQIEKNVTLPMARIVNLDIIFGDLIQAVNSSNGFSTIADLYIPTKWTSNSLSFPKYWETSVEDSFFLLLSDTASKQRGKIIPVKAETRDNFIRVVPMEALEQNRRYILVVTRSLRPDQQLCYRASASMVSIWDDFKNGDGGLYKSAFTLLEEKGMDLGNVLAISEFNTLWATRGLNQVRAFLDDLSNETQPEIEDWGISVLPTPENLRYVRANLNTPIFRNEDGYWDWDDTSDVQVQSWEDIPILFSLPEPEIIEKNQPYPIVLWGHGLGASKETLVMISEMMADNGYVMAGTDDICHGDREVLGPGFLESTECYLDLSDVRKTRDNIRESVAGKMWLIRAIKSLADVDIIPEGGDGIPDFDVSKIYYIALSMGTMHGGILTGIEQNVDAYVMSSASAKFTSLIFEGPFLELIHDISNYFDQIFQDVHTEEILFLFGHMFQHVLDPAESANFLKHAITNRLPGLEGRRTNILQQSVASDSTVGENGQIYFNRAAGYPQLMPFVWDVELVNHASCPYVGSGFFQFDSDDHFLLWGSGDLGDAYRGQIVHYLNSHKNSGKAEIINPFFD